MRVDFQLLMRPSTNPSKLYDWVPLVNIVPYVRTCVRTHVRAHARTYIHTYMRTHVSTHASTRACVRTCFPTVMRCGRAVFQRFHRIRRIACAPPTLCDRCRTPPAHAPTQACPHAAHAPTHACPHAAGPRLHAPSLARSLARARKHAASSSSVRAAMAAGASARARPPADRSRRRCGAAACVRAGGGGDGRLHRRAARAAVGAIGVPCYICAGGARGQ